MNHLDVLRQLGSEEASHVPGDSECVCVCVFFLSEKVSIHHITAWYPDHLKVSLRWFFFPDINRGCLLAPHDLIEAGFAIYLWEGNSGACVCAVKHRSLWTTLTPPTWLLAARATVRLNEWLLFWCPTRFHFVFVILTLTSHQTHTKTNRIHSGCWRRSLCKSPPHQTTSQH